MPIVKNKCLLSMEKCNKIYLISRPGILVLINDVDWELA
jgi:hypothetical protein